MQGIQLGEDATRRHALEHGFTTDMKVIYKTVWEIKQRELVRMAADRGAFIDQSQSFNVHIPDATYAKLTSLHFTAWRSGLKTGMYYLRTNPAADAIKFTVRIGVAPNHRRRHGHGRRSFCMVSMCTF